MSAQKSLETKQWIVNGIGAISMLAILACVTSRLWQSGVPSPFTDPLDFRAFYCAGSAVMQRANPYRLEPDRTCQREVLAAAGLRLNENFVLPAPLPPYALVAFGPLVLLPFRFASALWMSLNLLALLASIALAAKLSGVRPALIGAALFLSAGIVCLSLGQVVPLVLAAALLAAYCARRGPTAGAVLGAAIAAIEPHIALPVWLALALFIPAARKPLVVAALGIAALSLLPGFALSIEYVRSVIPQHARAELLNLEGQYGLSPLLAALNVAPEIALRAGSACYACMLAFGLALGFALRRRFDDPAFLVLTPLATVVLGGPFLHIQQTVVAIPLGFMLVARLRRYSVAQTAAVIAIIFLAIPWPLADMAVTSPPSAKPASIATTTLHPVSETTKNESIEIPYAAFIARFERRSAKHSVAELISRKIPTWFGLIGLLIIACRLAYGDDVPDTQARRLSKRAANAERA